MWGAAAPGHGFPGGAGAEGFGLGPAPLQGCSQGCGLRHSSRGEVGTKTGDPGCGACWHVRWQNAHNLAVCPENDKRGNQERT